MPASGNRVEQWLMVAGGGLLVAAGVRRGSLTGLALAAAGGALVYRGLSRASAAAAASARTQSALEATGAGVSAGIYDQVAQAAKEELHPAGELIADADGMIDDMIDDSFPASDPPSWTARP